MGAHAEGQGLDQRGAAALAGPVNTINALGIVDPGFFDDPVTYFTANVIGGPGAFVIPVYDWSQFAAAVRRKLILEIAALPPDLDDRTLEPPLVLEVHDPDGPVAVGTEATYELVIRNRGTKSAENVQVKTFFSHGIEPTPSETTRRSTPEWICSPSGLCFTS